MFFVILNMYQCLSIYLQNSLHNRSPVNYCKELLSHLIINMTEQLPHCSRLLNRLTKSARPNTKHYLNMIHHWKKILKITNYITINELSNKTCHGIPDDWYKINILDIMCWYCNRYCKYVKQFAIAIVTTFFAIWLPLCVKQVKNGCRSNMAKKKNNCLMRVLVFTTFTLESKL
jgi:hypothetical protein